MTARYLPDGCRPAGLPKFELLCGLPGSGKSVYAAARAERGAVVVSSADVRADLGDGCRNPEVFAEMDRRCAEALLDGLDAIYDATNLKRRFRAETISHMRDACEDMVEVVAAFIDVPLADAIARRMSADDGRDVSAVAIERMKRTMQEPARSEGYSAIYTYRPYPGDGMFRFDVGGFYAADYVDELSMAVDFDASIAERAMESGSIVLPDGSSCSWMPMSATGFHRDGHVLAEPGWNSPYRLLGWHDLTYLSGGLELGLFVGE